MARPHAEDVDAVAQFAAELRDLRLLAGKPSISQLAKLSERQGPRSAMGRSTIQDKLQGTSEPSLSQVITFIRACADHAASIGSPLDPAARDESRWHTLWLAMQRAPAPTNDFTDQSDTIDEALFGKSAGTATGLPEDVKSQTPTIIAYAGPETDIASIIRHNLSLAGRIVKLQRLAATDDDDVLDEMAREPESASVLLLLSRTSAALPWVKGLSDRRIRILADNHGLRIIPLLYESCAFPAGLTEEHFADFRSSLESGIEAVAEALHLVDDFPRGSLIRLGDALGQERLEDTTRRLISELRGSERLHLTADVGGTKAYIALMNEDAYMLHGNKFRTMSHGNPEGLFRFIRQSIREIVDDIGEVSGSSSEEVLRRISCIAVGFAGPVDQESGTILDAPNFRIRNFPLKARLSESLRIPVIVDNDVNLGLIGEAWKGSATGYRNVVAIIIGTGIGGGIMIEGKVFRGRSQTAGELGHMVIDYQSDKICGCGQRGCFEALASRRSIARDIFEARASADAADHDWNILSLASNEIADQFRNGDEVTVEAVEQAATVCGKAVFSILNLLNPDMIFFGGGLIRQIGEPFLDIVRAEAEICMNAIYERGDNATPITMGTLPNPILVGACKMAMEQTQEAEEVS